MLDYSEIGQEEDMDAQVVQHEQNQQQNQGQVMEVQQQVVASSQQTLLVNSANMMSTPQSPVGPAQPVPSNTPAPQMQQMTDWNSGGVQVLQQPVQSAYVQQVYNANGQMLMSLPPNVNHAGSIQVIAAGKPFQSNQLTSVLGKSIQASFPSYATIPTSTNQTLLIGQLGMIGGQAGIFSSQGQKQELKDSQLKQGQAMLHQLISPIQYAACQNRTAGGGNSVQLSPWQFSTQIPQVWASPQQQQVITAQNPIYIRSPQQEQVYIQPQQSVHMQNQSRTLSILPSISSPVRPAGPVVPTQIVPKPPLQNKIRKTLMMKGIPVEKHDAQNQTKPEQMSSVQQFSKPSEDEDEAKPAEETLSDSRPQDEMKPPPPKALVKPQVLTHVIEGYVIQESSQPFPTDQSEPAEIGNRADSDNYDESPSKRQKLDDDKDADGLTGAKEMCEMCGIVDDKEVFKLDNHYCPASTKSGDKILPNKLPDAPAIIPVAPCKDYEDALPSDLEGSSPTDWTVSDVHDFIGKLAGCSEYAEEFANQEIDGQALLLLKEDHLMSAMSMKLGPALKICASINRLRGHVEGQDKAN
ncbi:polyhomeotic-like protein 1 isoform X1 [Cimex lectularius]|uniref:SAM domain-containing protein n=1 Tax=Cimex lectularius TaxID=79782 RepID=A0A8I6REK6_CIMLE|nr:polyhomeotic-like protein 1 isoform X1 [Cimex lectularius]